jgi:enoyl-[acyl-carrier protein] reductase III
MRRPAKETLEQVRNRRSDGLLVRADVTRPDQITEMVQKIKVEFGQLDILVSNARPEVSKFSQPPLDITLEQWDTDFDSQGKAFLLGVREALPLMREDGRIFAITYAEGTRTRGHQPWVAMGAAKAALESLVRYFAVAVAKRGITVNAISPGWIEDSVLNTLPEEAQQLIRNWHNHGWTPMGRLGTPADVGDVVVLLCSEKARWITGQVIYADGGASLKNPEVPPEIQIG